MLSGYIGKATTAGSHAVAPHSAHADVELRLDRHTGRAPGERRHSELPAHTQWCRRPANRSLHQWRCSRAEELESDKPEQRGSCFQAPRGASALYCLSPRVSCLSEEATDPLPRPAEHHLAGSNGSDSRKVIGRTMVKLRGTCSTPLQQHAAMRRKDKSALKPAASSLLRPSNQLGK